MRIPVYSLLLSAIVMCGPYAHAADPDSLRVLGDVEEILLQRRHIGEPSAYEKLVAYSGHNAAAMEAITDAMVAILERGGESQNAVRGERLHKFAVDTAKHFRGSNVVAALKKVVRTTKDAGIRMSATCAIVCAETNNVVLYVKEVVDDNNSYSDLDRFLVYEEFLGRLKTEAGSGGTAKEERIDAIEFLKKQVAKEQTPESIIKIDAYLCEVDQNYKTSDSRRKLLTKGVSSKVPAHKRYFSEAVQALEKK